MQYWPIILFVALFSTSVVSAENRGDHRERIEPKGFLYGLGLGINQEIYKGYDYRVIPLPIIGYRADNFSVLGPFVSYDALSLSDFEVTIQLAPRFQGFDEADSYIFKNMATRKFSMDAGIGLNYEKKNWKILTSAMFDVLNNSNGYEVKASLSKVFRKGPLFFEPSLMLSYVDQAHVDYYYGIKADEINEFTSAFQGSSALNTSVGFSVATPIFLSGFTRLALDYTWYDSAITDSPLVEDGRNLSVRVLFSKFF